MGKRIAAAVFAPAARLLPASAPGVGEPGGSGRYWVCVTTYSYEYCTADEAGEQHFLQWRGGGNGWHGHGERQSIKDIGEVLPENAGCKSDIHADVATRPVARAPIDLHLPAYYSQTNYYADSQFRQWLGRCIKNRAVVESAATHAPNLAVTGGYRGVPGAASRARGSEVSGCWRY